jgi:hypothetical protein
MTPEAPGEVGIAHDNLAPDAIHILTPNRIFLRTQAQCDGRELPLNSVLCRWLPKC